MLTAIGATPAERHKPVFIGLVQCVLCLQIPSIKVDCLPKEKIFLEQFKNMQ